MLLRPIVWLFLLLQKQPSVLAEKREPELAAQPTIPASTSASTSAKKGFMAKIFALTAFLVMAVFIYLPATLALLSGACFCLWGIFYRSNRI